MENQQEPEIQSVTVKTEHGEFTARTHKLAVRLAKERERAISVEKAKAVEDTERALERCYAAAYRILRVVRAEAGTPDKKHTVYDFVAVGDKCRSLATFKEGTAKQILIMHMQDGDAELRLSRHLLGVLMSGGGHPLAIFTHNLVTNSRFCEAVGACNGHLRTTVVDGVLPEMFNECK